MGLQTSRSSHVFLLEKIRFWVQIEDAEHQIKVRSSIVITEHLSLIRLSLLLSLIEKEDILVLAVRALE